MTPLLALLLGCTEEWRNADIHIDVIGADWIDTDAVRLCLQGSGVHEQALGAGRVGFTGIEVGAAGPLRVDILDPDDDTRIIGHAGPVALSADVPWQVVDWEACSEAGCDPCTSEGRRVEEGTPSWLLSVRFL
jgi:hypothetical protein